MTGRPVDPVRPTWQRGLYGAIGLIFVGLGMAGAVLPVLPTTPFLLLALWAFSRSSQRLHDWLYTHPRFGPVLQAWRDHGVIPPRAKAASLIFMTASVLYVAIFTASPPLGVAAMAVVLALVGAWIATRPGRPPTPTPSARPPEEAP